MSGGDLEEVTHFILGAAFTQFELNLYGDYIDREQRKRGDDERAAYWERYRNEGPNAEEEPEWLWDDDSFEAFERRIIAKAPLDFECFRMNYARVSDNYDADYIQNHVPKLYPFSSLGSLILKDPSQEAFHILFAERSWYPSLSFLKFTGYYEEDDGSGPDNVRSWTPFWRLAITKYVFLTEIP